MTVSVKAPTSTTGSIQLNGSDVLTIESDRSVDIDSGTLHVDATNNRVGIGTSSPNYPLHVVSDNGPAALIECTGSGPNTGLAINKEQGSGDLGNWNAININGNDNTSYESRIQWVFDSIADGPVIGGKRTGSGETQLAFHTNSGETLYERMRIDSSGNLLIGTSSQLQSGTDHSIHIKSSTYPQITYQNTAAATGGTYWVSGQSSNDYWYLLPAPQNKGVYLTYTSTTGWSSFSDETLKENLVPIENALNKINTLRTVTGNYIDDPEHPHVFLIAQDVQAILPEAVHMNLDHNVLGMNYNEIIPLLTAGIKELKAENDTLKSQLSSLETRIQALESANV